MTRIVLHVGMDKTGTTAVQEAFSRCADRLRARGVLYPLAGRYPRDVNHLALARGLTPDPAAIPTPLPPPPAYRHMIDALHREIDAASLRVAVLSCEAFWLPLAFPALALSRLRADLAPHRVEVIAFLRPAGSYLRSSYAQAVRGPQRSRLGFDAHAERVIRARMLDYAGRTEELRRVFGPDRVDVRRYAPRAGGVLQAMLDAVGASDLRAELRSARSVNQRASGAGLRLLRVANHARVPRRVVLWTLEPTDRLWRAAAASSTLAARIDAALDPVDPAELRSLDRAHPIPAGLTGDPA